MADVGQIYGFDLARHPGWGIPRLAIAIIFWKRYQKLNQ